MVDDRHMQRAIELAQQWPHTHPNPRVGSVVVSEAGVIAGEGWHQGPGTDHAEVVALSEAGAESAGSTVYVTLEPCSHHGRTPPCTDALIAAGVATVVVGTIDPDSHVSGSGIRRLRDAGIEVIVGVLEAQARAVDRPYFHHRETGFPLVTAKWAMTLDGAVAAADASSQWITGEAARAEAHEMRSWADGVVVGAGTLRTDDPLLNVRLDDYQGPQPRPVIVSGTQGLPTEARIWARDPIVVSTLPREIPTGEILEVPGAGGLPDPVETCRALAARGLLGLLLEGGAALAGAWWRAGVIDRGRVYIGDRVGGGAGIPPLGGVFATISEATEVEFTSVRNVGDDVAIDFETSRSSEDRD